MFRGRSRRCKVASLNAGQILDTARRPVQRRLNQRRSLSRSAAGGSTGLSQARSSSETSASTEFQKRRS